MAPSARVECELDAPILVLYEKLVNFEEYRVWNPFVIRVTGAARAVPGATMTFHVRWQGEGEGETTSDEVRTPATCGRALRPCSGGTA